MTCSATGISVNVHHHAEITAHHTESEGCDWVKLVVAPGDIEFHFFRLVPEAFVTAIVGALPEPRRVALLKVLTAEWYAASAKAEGLTAPVEELMDFIRETNPASLRILAGSPAPEDERFEETP